MKNDWEPLLIWNPDYRNEKQVFNAIILWHKTRSKKMMRYLNKHNFCVSYVEVVRQSKKLENDEFNGESGTIPLLKGFYTHCSIDNVNG